MTDRDVVDEVAALWGKKVYTIKRPEPYKAPYNTNIQGVDALSIMLSVFPHMGQRRQQKIEEALSAWEHPRKDLRRGR